MIITRKRLHRRTFLRGLGTVLSIPMLDAMVPALGRGRAFDLKAPTRMAFVYVPNGIVMKDWTPSTTGQDYQFTRILKPLEVLRKDIYVLSNLDSQTGNALGDGPGDHARVTDIPRLRIGSFGSFECHLLDQYRPGWNGFCRSLPVNSSMSK